MDERQRAGFLVALVGSLAEGGFVGKTHVQKTVYFAQEAAGVNLGFRFVIHHYGPYSFELDSMVQTLEAEGVLAITPEPDGYGYRISPGLNSGELEIASSLRSRAEHIAGYFAGLQAVDLELLSTALYVRRRLPDTDEGTWIGETRRLKPKFTEAKISEALKEAAGIAAELASS